MHLFRKNVGGRCAGSRRMKRIVARVMASLGVLFASTQAHAIAVSLTASDPGGTTSFDTAGNWSNAAAPSAGNTYSTGAFQLRSTLAGAPTFAGDSLTIDAGGNFLLKGPGAHTINNLILNGGSISHGDVGVAGQVGTVAGNINVLANSSLISGPNISSTARNLTINSIISGAGNLTVIPAVGDVGLVVLNGNNGGYTGVINVNAGTLRVRNSNALGTTGAANTVLNILGTAATGGNGTNVQFENNVTIGESFQLNTGAGDRRNSLISNSGTNTLTGPINISGGSIVNFTVSGGTFNINGNVTESGWTGGSLLLRGGGGTGNVNGNINIGARDLVKTDANTWIINTTGNNWNNTIVAVGTLQLGTGNALDTGGIVTMGQADGNSPLLRLNGHSQEIAGLTRNGSNTGANTRVAGGNAALSTLVINNSSNFTYNALIGGTGTNENNLALVKSGAGMQTLSGNNTFAGLTTINDGILRIASANALGSTGNGTLIKGNTTGSGILELTGGLAFAAEPLTLEARQGATAAIPHLRNVSGINTFSGPITLTTGGAIYNLESAGGHLTLGSIVASPNSGTRRLNLFGAGDGTFAGSIAMNPGASLNELNKDGTGTWTLAGNTTGFHAINIDQGTLALTGAASIGSSPTISVANGAFYDVSGLSSTYHLLGGQTLINNGTIVGDVIADAGSTISPGLSIGLLTFNDDLDVDGNLVIEVDPAGAGSVDMINVLGVLDVSNALLTFNFVSLPLDDGAYVFAKYGSLVGEFAGVNIVPTGYQVRYQYRGNQIALVALPAPVSLGWLGMAALGLSRRRRKGR